MNGGADNKQLLPGVPGRKRIINYIPAGALSEEITERLKTGDYVGIYTNRPDIDVSHVGIVIRDGKRLLFRHASSKAPHRKVVDEDFMEYMINKPGLVILRARPIK